MKSEPNGILWGCPECGAIFDPPVFSVIEGEIEEYWFCPNCGQPAVELGIAPGYTEAGEGLFYLTDGTNMMGPYPTKEKAQQDMWAWFGGRDAFESEGKSSRQAEEDSEDGESGD